MEIKIKNVGFDLYESQHNLIAVNAADATIENNELQLPMVSAHQSELLKSEEAKIFLKSPLFQYVHVPRKQNKINEKLTKDSVTQNYKNLIEKYPNLVADFYYQYYEKYPPKESERDAILDIQRNAGAIILSDYEIDPEQSVDKFESQILGLRNNNSKYVLSPTLDINIETIGLFAKKIDKLLEHKFQRFNVIFRSISTHQANWIDLSHRIFLKDIWCNVVGVPQRYLSNTNRISLLSTPFLYGVHSTSLGYPIIRKKKNGPMSKYNFNNTTYHFDEIQNISDPESRTISINDQVDELKIARKHIIKKTFFSKYIPTKSGLLETLGTIP